jgi:hypothetical protein
VNNNEIYYTCVGIRHKETSWKLLNNTEWGERVKKCSGGDYTDLSTIHVQAKIPLTNEQTPKLWRTRMKNKSC